MRRLVFGGAGGNVLRTAIAPPFWPRWKEINQEPWHHAAGHHCAEWVQGGEVGERERGGLIIVLGRDRSEEVRAVRNRRSYIACLPPIAIVM